MDKASECEKTVIWSLELNNEQWDMVNIGVVRVAKGRGGVVRRLREETLRDVGPWGIGYRYITAVTADGVARKVLGGERRLYCIDESRFNSDDIVQLAPCLDEWDGGFYIRDVDSIEGETDAVGWWLERFGPPIIHRVDRENGVFYKELGWISRVDAIYLVRGGVRCMVWDVGGENSAVTVRPKSEEIWGAIIESDVHLNALRLRDIVDLLLNVTPDVRREIELMIRGVSDGSFLSQIDKIRDRISRRGDGPCEPVVVAAIRDDRGMERIAVENKRGVIGGNSGIYFVDERPRNSESKHRVTFREFLGGLVTALGAD